MFQPSWGGGPAGSPPHARMTSSLQPSMQLQIFDDVGHSHLQRLFDLHVSGRFCEPFPTYRGNLGCIYLMYSDDIVLVLAVIPGTACMWDSSLYFYLAHDYASYILWFGPLFTGHTILLYFVSAGIGMPPPPPSAQVPSHKKRLVAPASLVSSGSSPSAHYLPHTSLSDTPFVV